METSCHVIGYYKCACFFFEGSRIREETSKKTRSIYIFQVVTAVGIACDFRPKKNYSMVIITVRNVSVGKRRKINNDREKERVNIRKLYSPRQKFSGVSALTVRNKRDLRCKIVAEKNLQDVT